MGTGCIFNYDKEHEYEKEENGFKEEDIPTVVDQLYTVKKDHIQVFVKDSLKVMLQEEMPDEYIINNLLSEIFRDDELCKNRLIMEIKLHQQKVQNGTIDYKKI